MTPTSIIYFVTGLVILAWPLYTILFKRHVTTAQWYIMTAIVFFGLTMIIYSSFFNTFLQGENLLMILYIILTLSVPPLTQIAVVAQTDMHGVSRLSRVLAYPSLFALVAMGLSVAICGADMYDLWIKHCCEGNAGRFIAHNWRYNTIVAMYYYLYWTVLLLEITIVTIHAAFRLSNFNHILGEYYSSNHNLHKEFIGIYASIAVLGLTIAVGFLLIPFNVDRPLWLVITECAIQGGGVLFIGHYASRLSNNAETLGKKIDQGKHLSKQASASYRLINHIENDKAYLNPDLSVFILSEQLHMHQDDVVDTIHRFYGSSFKEYIDGLRIEYSIQTLVGKTDFQPDDQEQLAQLAHQCGFLTADAYLHAFQQVMQTDIASWWTKLK